MVSCGRLFAEWYHHVEAEQFPEYVREFCFRFSRPELFQNPLYYAEKSLTLVPTR